MAGDSPPPPGRAAGRASPRAPEPASRPAAPAPVAAAPAAYWRAAGAAGFGLAARPAHLAASPRPPPQQAGLHRARGERSRYVSGRERDSILCPRYAPAPFPAAANRSAPPPPPTRPSGYRGGAARRALSSAVGSAPRRGAGPRGALWGAGCGGGAPRPGGPSPQRWARPGGPGPRVRREVAAPEAVGPHVSGPVRGAAGRARLSGPCTSRRRAGGLFSGWRGGSVPGRPRAARGWRGGGSR